MHTSYHDLYYITHTLVIHALRQELPLGDRRLHVLCQLRVLDLLLVINNGDYLPLEELAEDGAGVLAGLPEECHFSIVLECRGVGKRCTHVHLGGRGRGEEGGKAGEP